MKISVFTNIDGSFSMERYADELIENMPAEFEVIKVSIDRRAGLRGKVIDKWIRYLIKARKGQGDWNIIVDEGYSHLLLGLNPKRTIVVCHDVNPLFYDKTSFMQKIVYKSKLRFMANARYVVAVSEYTKSKILEKCSYMDSERVKVVYNGLSTYFRVIRDKKVLGEFKVRHGLGDKKILLHVGNDNWYKNFSSLIKAFNLLKEENKFLVKIGRITKEENDLIDEYKLRNRLLNITEIPLRYQEELVKFYNIADVFVFPSLSEGFGWPPLEAMACGCPVIASNRASLPEVCGGACVYVDPENHEYMAEKIEDVLRDDGLRQELVNKGLDNVKRFRWDKTVKNIINLIHDDSR